MSNLHLKAQLFAHMLELLHDLLDLGFIDSTDAENFALELVSKHERDIASGLYKG